ncbi:MAG: hypothetical protein LQ351_006954 [Letrouitia transgressa]|nr:MAG: hypothetical protein LQ351_006954 [Letrouitia transgressa]
MARVSPCNEPSIFGKFEKCLTFHSKTQYVHSGQAVSTVPNNVPLPEKKVLVSERDVYEYLKNLDDVWDVCVMAFISALDSDNCKLPLPLAQNLFEHISSLFNISSTFLTVLEGGVARYVSSARRNETDQHWEQAQFIIQQNRSYSSYSIALTFEFTTGKVRALIFGIEAPVLELFDYLDRISPLPFGPTIIPALALELQLQRYNITIKSCQSQIYHIENLTGMRQFNHAFEYNGAEIQDWKDLDLIDITRNLSGFLRRFAFLRSQLETEADLVCQMRLSTEFLRTELERRKEDQNKIDDQDRLLSKFDNNGSWYLGLRACCNYLTERTQAQVQTVYNLISSQNSFSSASIARSSLSIAEARQKDSEAMLVIANNSYRDNQLMLEIARDSRAVAMSTAKDSATMRVIAAVTILFLPATFLATFFSMTFFNFADNANILGTNK